MMDISTTKENPLLTELKGLFSLWNMYVDLEKEYKFDTSHNEIPSLGFRGYYSTVLMSSVCLGCGNNLHIKYIPPLDIVHIECPVKCRYKIGVPTKDIDTGDIQKLNDYICQRGMAITDI